jgi:rhodanese-related sulfurtransferase
LNRVLQEGLVVALVGAALAFAANALSPRGLKLSRDYFPSSPPVTHPPVATTNPPAILPATNQFTGVAEATLARLREKGLQLVDSTQAEQFFRDPRADQGLIIFVDARDDDHYQHGHIPGAYQLYHYRPEGYLPALLPACQIAQQIVVYCNGGECEDSEFAALMLRDTIRVPNEKLFVYPGGIADWEKHAFPVETGARKSGQLRNPAK